VPGISDANPRAIQTQKEERAVCLLPSWKATSQATSPGLPSTAHHRKPKAAEYLVAF